MHTPYDGSHKLFTIGVKPLDPAEWIDVDDKLLAYLDEKDRLAERVPEKIFVAEPGTEAAQAEVLTLLADHLPERFPDIYQRLGPQIDIIPAFRRVRLDTPYPPLLIAGGLVQEDLVLMRRGEDGWRLAAAHLCFPSSWRLNEKFGKALQEIHAPVPDFGRDTRNATIIERMFDNLRPEQPVMRWNWSLHADDVLHHPHSAGQWRFGDDKIDSLYFRLERQTLRRLPESGDILFTIRIYLDPLKAMEAQPNAPELAQALISQLRAYSAAQLDYKGLTSERDRLIAHLEVIAAR
ncbi:heme-dependent oxidative N-demethylase family protein [Asticcacaulis taihuensis]|uniref:heme-dependent oxidative N-demethylase family protein n=1 Tax=Asticcacaulis taihuensis TaxID=260084 RepID=UPI003F7B9EFC